MCDPVSLTIASIGVGAIGSGFSAYQQVQAGQAQNAAYQHQALVQQEQGRYKIAQINSQYAKVAGQQRAIIAAGGVSQSSFGDVIADSFTDAALQAKAAQYGADAASENLREQGANAEANGKAGAFGTIIGGFGSAIGGAAKIPQMSSTSISSPWQTSVSFAG